MLSNCKFTVKVLLNLQEWPIIFGGTCHLKEKKSILDSENASTEASRGRSYFNHVSDDLIIAVTAPAPMKET